ncbi:MAG: primosomal protein N' [Clostridia bacterium]|nr:primosomal protein N' [Clostridia bacterium]
MSLYEIASVYILDAPYQIDKLYDYYIPGDLRRDICAGIFAAVPFGRGNRPMTALVAEIKEDRDDCTNGLKSVCSLMSDSPILSDEQLKMVEFLRERTFCTTGDAVRAILPSSAFAAIDIFYVLADCEYDTDSLNSIEAGVVNYLLDNGKATVSRLVKDVHCDADEAVLTLLRKNIIKRDFVFHENKSNKFLNYLTVTSAADPYISGEKRFRSEKLTEILRFVCECGRATDKYVRQELDCSLSQIKNLISKNLMECERVDLYKNPYDFPESESPAKKLVLNSEQQAADRKLAELLEKGEPCAVLLHGVTGSGKTSVIKSVADRVLAMGRQVIILVPEIALTPQTLSVFGAYYGDNIAVMHSSLSSGERYDAYRRMQEGLVNVCIGTRSAIFAPFKNLGLIVIDEEQEHTYKSENNPKYSALDVARFRCGYHNSMMLLASATPSVNSYYNAESGRYTLIELNNRYGNAALPDAEIVDMREEFNRGSLGAIGTRLRDGIRRSLDRGEQAVIFLNRRGYSSYASCPQCGEAISCPHCSVSLTRHNYRSGAKLVCHYCGYSTYVPEKCPNCGGDHIRFMGYGTQKVEEELQNLFPDKEVVRMDADTTGTKASYEEMLSAFRNHEGDILLGTQMVTKGHDFPDVTLSGVLLADMSLYLDDFRAGERTFSLITQVVGRAGRADKPGKAIIQTFNPEHPTLKLAAAQDYKGFYKNEIALRKALVFPPFCDIFLITVTDSRENDCIKLSQLLLKRLKELLSQNPSVKMQIFGPFEAPVYKVNEKYRWRFVLKAQNTRLTRTVLSYLIKEMLSLKGFNSSVSIDVNPNNL